MNEQSFENAALGKSTQAPTSVWVQMGTVEYRWLAGSWVMYDHALEYNELVVGPTVELLDEIRRHREIPKEVLTDTDRQIIKRALWHWPDCAAASRAHLELRGVPQHLIEWVLS